MANYEKVFNAYVKWAEKNSVDVYNARQVPLFSHADSQNPETYEFLDILAADFERQGKGWDLWLNTPEGQKLNAQWQSVANCHVKLGTVMMLYYTEAMETDDERLVTWNWCSAKEGVGAEQLMSKHKQVASTITDDAPFIGWAAMVPTVGGANTPGDFAHVVIYPDMQSFMAWREYSANGGWRGLRDYYASYADCHGESLNIETVIHRPAI